MPVKFLLMFCPRCEDLPLVLHEDFGVSLKQRMQEVIVISTSGEKFGCFLCQIMAQNDVI